MSEKYKAIKTVHKDWLEIAVEDFKQCVRILILETALRHGNYLRISNRIENAVEEICEEIDDKEIRDRTRKELLSFSEESYKQATGMVGNLTAHQFVNAMLGAKYLTERQKEDIVNAVKKSPALMEKVEKVKEPSARAYNRATPNDIFYPKVQKAIKETLKNYESLTSGKNYIANVNPRNIAEMNVRYSRYIEEKQTLKGKGVKVVFVPGHVNCSQRCKPYQNRFYSLDGTSGVIDGHPYVPIEDASDNVIYTSPKTGRTYYAGLFSYNCNHQMEEYRNQQVIEIPDKLIKKSYEIQQQQRRMERQYRYLREKYMIYRVLFAQTKNANMQKIAASAYKKAVLQKKLYIEFSEKNKVPYYPDRLKVTSGENLYIRTSGDEAAKKVKI